MAAYITSFELRLQWLQVIVSYLGIYSLVELRLHLIVPDLIFQPVNSLHARAAYVNHYPAKVIYLNFHLLEVVSR